MTERERLPNRRRNETIDFVFDRVNYAATVGFFDDGRPGEVFAHGAKVGSMLDLLFDDACVTLSLLLQHGADPKKLAASMGRAGGDEPASIIGMLTNLVAERHGTERSDNDETSHQGNRSRPHVEVSLPLHAHHQRFRPTARGALNNSRT